MLKELEELQKWHEENASETEGEQGQEFAHELHKNASELLKKIFSAPWFSVVTAEMVEGWSERAISNLADSLNVAVETTITQVCEEEDTDFQG